MKLETCIVTVILFSCYLSQHYCISLLLVGPNRLVLYYPCRVPTCLAAAALVSSIACVAFDQRSFDSPRPWIR